MHHFNFGEMGFMGGKRERMDCSHPHSHLLEEGNPLRTLSRIRTSELCLDSVAWGMSVWGGGGAGECWNSFLASAVARKKIEGNYP